VKVEFSKEADQDLESIGDWIAQENPDRAYRFVRELRVDCLTLSDFPERYAIYKKSDIGNIRRKPHGNYLIFYVVEQNMVSISRVLHGAQDYSDLF
jgi:toxin ParE1/3/4